MNTQYRKNLKAVAQACKNYTDKEIKASEERILSIVARNNVDFIDHINEPTYRFTAPANAKLMMLQSVGGNSVKYAPTTASDTTSAYQKTIPSYSPSIDRANASMNILGGMSYKVNQLVANGNFADSTGWGVNGATSVVSNNKITITANITSQAVSIATTTSMIGGNKYLIAYNLKPSKTGNTRVWFNNELTELQSTTANTNTRHFTFFTPTNTATSSLLFYLNRDGCVDGDSGEYSDIIVFNLTADFGSGNEPSTVSDCATEYAKRGIDIYSYTPQQSAIRDTAITNVKSVGFNIWDEEWENGIYNNNDGSKVVYANGVRNKNYISVLPNTLYFINKQVYMYAYDINKKFITMIPYAGANILGTFTTPSNCHYINFQYYGTTYNNDICINISNVSLNGTYKPYFTSSLLIDSHIQALDGYGWGVNDTYYNYIDFNSKKFIKKVARVDLGTLNWEKHNEGFFYATISDGVRDKTDSINGLCSKYDCVNGYSFNSNLSDTTIKQITVGSAIYGAQRNAMVHDDTYSSGTAEAFKIAMSGVYLVYELVSPVETDISQYLDGNEIEIEPNGTLSFESTYSAYVPSNVSYNGVIKHALATAVKQDGFNVWDEEWEILYTSFLFSKNFIPVLPNTTYYFKCLSSASSWSLYFYDENQNKIGEQLGNPINTTFTTPSGCSYIKFNMVGYGLVYKNDICINISGTLNGTYKPYKAPITRLLPNSEAKYSWGITNGVRNTRIFCDDECNPVNEGQLDVGNQDLELLSWIIGTGDSWITNNTIGMKESNPSVVYEGAFISSKYYLTPTTGSGIWRANTITCITQSTGLRINIGTIETKPSGYLVFERAIIDTETLDDFDFSFDCEEGDTFTIIGCELLQCYATYSFLIKEAKSNE